MKAVQLTAHGSPGRFEVRELPDPQPGPDEAVVQVEACGLNHLDIWTEGNALPISVSLPRIPGGEIAGKVKTVGTEVEGWQAGDRVAVQSNLFCGTCEFCVRGEETLCLNGRLIGVHLDGGMAEQVKVPARALAALPEAVSAETSAALTLAGSTAMHMLTRRVTVEAGQWVLVMGGASGVGSAAIQIARGLGARVISTGSTEAKRQLALALGAEAAVDSTQSNWNAEVRRITGKRGVDLVVEHIGGEVLEMAFQCLARGGSVVTCGATAGREVRIQLWPFFVKQQRLIGSYGRNRPDLIATLDWAAAGRLRPVIDRVYLLEQVPEAYDRLRGRQVLGKLLVKPQ